jgi:hypothetical protein
MAALAVIGFFSFFLKSSTAFHKNYTSLKLSFYKMVYCETHLICLNFS